VDTEWDAAAVFDEDHLYFYESLLSERSDAEAARSCVTG